MTHAEILSRWRYRADLARVIGVPYTTIVSWRVRSSIPAEYWPVLVRAAALADIDGVTLESLAAAAAAQKAAKPLRRNASAKRQAAYQSQQESTP